MMVGRDEKELLDAAVLIPLYRGDDDETRLVLLKRTAWGIHGGQIAFPGGKHSPQDRTMADTALRETYEEIGLEPGRIEILDELPIMVTMTSGFRIYPFLARIDRPESWRPDAREVAEILEVRLSDLADPEAYGEEMWELPGWKKRVRIEFCRIGDYKLWGVTYRILSPLLPRLVDGEWPI